MTRRKIRKGSPQRKVPNEGGLRFSGDFLVSVCGNFRVCWTLVSDYYSISSRLMLAFSTNINENTGRGSSQMVKGLRSINLCQDYFNFDLSRVVTKSELHVERHFGPF